MKSLFRRIFDHSSQSVLRVGILGLGRISGVHIRAFRRNPRVVIEHVADSNKTLLVQTARQLGVKKYTTTYADVLHDPSVQAVDILLPHNLHARITREALRAGKHVICEKPLAIRPPEVDAIQGVSRTANRNAYLKQYLRFSRLHQQLKDIVGGGHIGKPYLVSCVYTTDDRSWYTNPHSWRGNTVEAGGGVFMDVGVHIIDFLQDVLGRATSVSALMKKNFTTLSQKGEDVSLVTLEFINDVAATIVCTSADTSYGFRWEKHIYGSDGSLHLVAIGKSHIELVFQKNQRARRMSSEKNWWEKANVRALDDITNRIVSEIPPAITLDHAKHTMQIIQAAYASARSRRNVKIRI